MHVLVGYDESEQADRALRHAVERYPEATISAVHVSDPREWIAQGEEEGPQFVEGAYDRVSEAATKTLKTAEGIAAEYDREIRTEAIVGGPARAMVEYAEEADVDHIVLGSHGRRGVRRFLLGSVSEAVAKRSPVSVTMIRNPPDED
ncbi:universal stress protein [Halolamina sp.]|jgi:nucleotide-binding universal stress UspA family protein|uniref:universal stress protein n=1 Tax=Halolamina sp. TaxID=1940283 RepID=UPI000223B584|nr:UspA domain-containing protein [halophilic archaeon DL31]